ncbi:hypothetical protein L1887_40386 [Cichorium endivia]|nr:hypothetical protein L1887_40386 [Cichorium endivia]
MSVVTTSGVCIRESGCFSSTVLRIKAKKPQVSAVSDFVWDFSGEVLASSDKESRWQIHAFNLPFFHLSVSPPPPLPPCCYHALGVDWHLLLGPYNAFVFIFLEKRYSDLEPQEIQQDNWDCSDLKKRMCQF